jgi:hypothetical protein
VAARPWQLVTAVTAVAGLAAFGVGIDRSDAEQIASIDLDTTTDDAPILPVPTEEDADDPRLITPAAPLHSVPTAPSPASPASVDEPAEPEVSEPEPAPAPAPAPGSDDSGGSVGSIDSD